MRFILLSLLLVACGPSPLEYRCDVPGIGGFQSEFYLDCDMVREEVALSFEVLDTWRLVLQEDQHLYEHVPVFVYRAWCVPGWDGEECASGEYSWWPSPYIQLGYHRLSLMHEELHHWDSLNLSPGTTRHLRWDRNGYDLSDDASFQPGMHEVWERYGYQPVAP